MEKEEYEMMCMHVFCMDPVIYALQPDLLIWHNEN